MEARTYVNSTTKRKRVKYTEFQYQKSTASAKC